jgi:hypothetical protein
VKKAIIDLKIFYELVHFSLAAAAVVVVAVSPGLTRQSLNGRGGLFTWMN